jgi:hypothetical protein
MPVYIILVNSMGFFKHIFATFKLDQFTKVHVLRLCLICAVPAAYRLQSQWYNLPRFKIRFNLVGADGIQCRARFIHWYHLGLSNLHRTAIQAAKLTT